MQPDATSCRRYPPAGLRRISCEFLGFRGTRLAGYCFWHSMRASGSSSKSPSSAAITVAILALPTRGQGMEKAGYRLLATAIGVAASIAIAGILSQTDGLLLAVFGIWVGLCVYVRRDAGRQSRLCGGTLLHHRCA